MICRADPQPRASVIDKIYDIIVLELFNIDLWRNIHGLFGGIATAGIGVENADLLDLSIEIVHLDTGIFRKMLKPMGLKVFEMVANEFRGQDYWPRRSPSIGRANSP